MLLYDYILTIDQEADLIWKKPNGASIIFGLNRIVTLGLICESATGQLHHYTYESCKGLTILSEVIILLSYAIWAVVSALRVYALTKRNWWLSTVTFVLGIAPLAVDLYVGTTISYRIIPLGNETLCQEDTNVNRGFYRKSLIICRGCSIVSDLLVLGVTMYHILPRSLVFSRMMWSRKSFTRILLRDGILYFATLTTLNALEIALYLTATDDFINYFIAPVSTVFVSRFMLNLRACASTPVMVLDSQAHTLSSTEHSTSQTLTLAFTPVASCACPGSRQPLGLEAILTTSCWQTPTQ
ncbi:uncharacterized protein B0H18DRAFT_1064545 [Fomitopsis serialis]|uniref:uncharacterized protein n=1 Tax=Fomitopsis serialis TaxID=139415 RepID=UPI00200856DD|nr:uncharacterized protein B0H18DRAFT_1064545 [Neoantrodia serialis]KAH9911118.1 hypothetical protein B0H18DRAFT_1064545 [Neoantrodia serialis]